MSLWKRGFLEIIAGILDCLIDGPLKKTRIAFRCNLDSRTLEKYLSFVQRLGLVKRDSDDVTCYVITQKGLRYRNQFHSFISMIEEDLENFSDRVAPAVVIHEKKI